MKNPWKELSKVSPQRDNGHRRINTEIWRALMLMPLTSAAYKVIFCVIDRTWGYDQNDAQIGYSAFQKSTGLTKVSIRNGIKEAVDKKLLVVEPGNFKESARYLFNKHYDTWLGIPVLMINTGKAEVTSPGKANSTTPGIPRTSGLSYATKNITKNITKREIDNSLNKKENTDGKPDRSEKYFKGKYGHMVDK